jgi:hypothetical protein
MFVNFLKIISREVKRYKNSIIFLTIYVTVLLYPLMVVILNPPPLERNLVTLHARVIRMSQERPNVTAATQDGTVQNFDFPSGSYSLTHGFGPVPFGKTRLSEIPLGCSGELKTDQIRLFFLQRVTRIWELHCGKFVILYDDIRAGYRRDLVTNAWLNAVGHLFFLSLCGLIIYSDWKTKGSLR